VEVVGSSVYAFFEYEDDFSGYSEREVEVVHFVYPLTS